MAVIICTGPPGAPGVTTSALGLALDWPRNVVLADCSRQPTQAIQAGHLRGMEHSGRGLPALARMHRENRPLGPGILASTIPLSDSQDPTRTFLPGFPGPAVVRLFDPVWPDLADAFASLDDQETDVVVDAGHVERDGLPMPLLTSADLICFFTRTTLPSLAASRLYLPVLQQQLENLPVDKPLGLVLIGPGRPYGAREITAQFTLPCWAELDWDPPLAAVLSDGAPEPRRIIRRSLMNQYRTTGLALRERLSQSARKEHLLLTGASDV